MIESYANLGRSRGFACLSWIFPAPLVFISGYANTEEAFYCLNDDYGPFLSLYFALSALFRYYLLGTFNIDAMFAPKLVHSILKHLTPVLCASIKFCIFFFWKVESWILCYHLDYLFNVLFNNLIHLTTVSLVLKGSAFLNVCFPLIITITKFSNLIGCHQPWFEH